MATLTAWKFSTAHGADAAEYTVKELEHAGHLKVHDAAVVTWEIGDKRPRTRQLNHPEAHGAVKGSFWGFVLGLLFFAPLLGAAVGAVVGAKRGSLSDVGIDDAFADEVRREVVPGTSAIFLLTSDGVESEVVKAFKGQEMHLISSNLSSEAQRRIQQAMSDGGET